MSTRKRSLLAELIVRRPAGGASSASAVFVWAGFARLCRQPERPPTAAFVAGGHHLQALVLDLAAGG